MRRDDLQRQYRKEQRALENELEEASWSWWKAEKVLSKLRILKLALEVVCKGYSFRPAQDSCTDPTAFVPGEGLIRLPWRGNLDQASAIPPEEEMDHHK